MPDPSLVHPGPNPKELQMYALYLLSFKLLHATGMKKTSVRLARSLEKYSRQPLDNSKLYAAVWEFVLNTPAFPFCLGDHGCYLPVLSEDDPFHKHCRDMQADDDARIVAYEAENAYFYSRCQQSSCWEEAVKDGYCQKDWDYNFLCSGCGELDSECHGDCYYEKMCAYSGCYEDKVKDDFCQNHWEVENICICGNEHNSCSCSDADDDQEEDDSDYCQFCQDSPCSCVDEDPLAGDIDRGEPMSTYYERHGSMVPGFGWKPYPWTPYDNDW